jgi:hypothetical protein
MHASNVIQHVQQLIMLEQIIVTGNVQNLYGL